MSYLSVQEVDPATLRAGPGYTATRYPRKGGYQDVAHLQAELFARHAGRDNRLLQNIPNGVRVYEFTCSNYGLRDYDAGDFMVRRCLEVTLC